MKIYDVSLTISKELPSWPGDIKPEFVLAQSLEKGDVANVSHITMSAHTGTHVDAPSHFLPGESSVENLPLERLVGSAQVIEVEGSVLSKEALEKAAIPQGTKRLLLKTRNSEKWEKSIEAFDEKYVALSSDGASYLIDKGVELVGVDYLSVATFHELKSVHHTLLEKGVVILEALDLSQVEPGAYTLYCLPLKLKGVDGAPARTILTQA